MSYEESYDAWQEEAWNDLSDARLDGEEIGIPNGVPMPGHIVDVVSRKLSPKVLDPNKPPVVLVEFKIRILLEDGTTTHRNMREIWCKAPFVSPDGVRHPADVRELMRFAVMAMGDNAPRDASGRLLLDKDHSPEWWSKQMVGFPVRVKATERKYTRSDGTSGSTQDFRPAGEWPEGEVIEVDEMPF